MNAPTQPDQANRTAAFDAYERPIRIRNYKVGAILAFIFMPAGASLDWFVYRHTGKLGEFFAIRILCSALLAGVWSLLHFKPAIRSYRAIGSLVALLPMFSISWMIYETQGGASPYYAGLNLVMLGAAILLRWTLLESILVFFLSLVVYLSACILPGPHGPITDTGTFFNNVYFLFVTGVFNVVGSWYYHHIRYREFELRFELDQNRKMLEEGNQKLKALDEAKSRFFANWKRCCTDLISTMNPKTCL